jgi:protein NRD1
LDANQLALLQHLTQSAKRGQEVSSHPPAPALLPVRHDATDPRQRLASNNIGRDQQDSHENHDRLRHYDDYRDENHPRGSFRGSFRGGGRGRGGHGDGRNREGSWSKDNEYSQRRGRRSRSRSPPPRHQGLRPKPHSPPQRSTLAAISNNQDQASKAGDIERDEFGRDLRPSTPPAHSSQSSVEASVPATSFPINHDQTSLSSSIAADISPAGSASSGELGLESFNISTFDFTSPVAWESLGKMWQVTNGETPSTEQLMQFVMSLGTGAAIQTTVTSYDQGGWNGNSSHSARGGSKGRGRGRGGFGYTNQSYSYGSHDHRLSNMEDSDAIDLGGRSNHQGSVTNDSGTGDQEGSRPGPGRMQKVGDRWIFLRDPIGVT